MRATLRATGRRASLARRLPGRRSGVRALARGRLLERNGVALPVARAAARGVVAAMAMSGMREVTMGLGLVKQTPPDAVMQQQTGGMIARVPERHRRVAVQLAHWTYGAAGGAAFGLLPRPLRAWTPAGPIYGVLSWLGFELGLAPLMGLPHAQRPDLAESAALAADHVLYGTLVGATGWAKRS